METVMIVKSIQALDDVLNLMNKKTVFFIDNTSYLMRMKGILHIEKKFFTIKSGINRITILNSSVVEVIKLETASETNDYRFKLNNGHIFDIILDS